MIKIGIQERKNSFSEGWIQYCKKNGVSYKLIDVYSNDVISQLEDCDAFMWHFHHTDYRDIQFAKSLLRSLEQKGIKVFPNSASCWHFDDKIAQKYLLEAIGAPLVPTYVFYTEKDAMKWIHETTFPKVFKLKGGAGASNVKLACTRKDALKLIKQCFGKGFRQYRYQEQIKENYRKFKSGKNKLKDIFRPLYYEFIKKYPTDLDHYLGKEIGYAYFQDFIPNNTFDIRVCVVGNKAFALKRMVRTNDFRASGSGNILYNRSEIDERCIKIAFEVNQKLKMQSVAFDFVFDGNNNPLIVEISYGYTGRAYRKCEGYWTDDMQWHEETGFDFYGWMVENTIG